VSDEAIYDHCGIVGIHDPHGELDVPNELRKMLSALQHRGQESAGVALLRNCGDIEKYADMGLVRDVFREGGCTLPSTRVGIGHVRYSTSGSSCKKNAGPFVVRAATSLPPETIAIAHNGNIVNHESLRLEIDQFDLTSDTDSEVIAALILSTRGNVIQERILRATTRLIGAYSLVLLCEGTLLALRDPYGMRPLVLGRMGSAHIVASETCALSQIGAAFEREIEPGELVSIGAGGLQSDFFQSKTRRALCVFENIYFCNETSIINGKEVYLVREELGRQLAIEHPVAADLVIAVPNTAVPMALGYAETCNLPYAQAIKVNTSVNRTFILPRQHLRESVCVDKYSIVSGKVNGKRVVVIDDSIVRGTTMLNLTQALRLHGASEVHVRVASPPIRHPCYFGVDIPTEDELVANRLSLEGVQVLMRADSLEYLSIDGLSRALGANCDEPLQAQLLAEYCYGCMNIGGYPSF
jgi:amidophosphoribosyltransferase